MDHHESTIERMQARIRAWEQAHDTRAVFLNCYALMTTNMHAALDSSEFHDRDWVRRLLDHFAGYYFNALEAYDSDALRAPAVWRCAHAACHLDSHALQKLLLGVNAHINYDLVLALADLLEPEWDGLSFEMREQRLQDYNRVNDVIVRTVDVVQDTIVEPEEPILEVLDAMLGPVDEWVVTRQISDWRDEVWEQAVRRIETRELLEREAHREQVEAAALRWAYLFGALPI